MIEIRRDGAELQLIVESGYLDEVIIEDGVQSAEHLGAVQKPILTGQYKHRIIFRRQCGTPLECQLLKEYMDKIIGDRAQQIRIKAFEEGKVIEKSKFERDF